MEVVRGISRVLEREARSGTLLSVPTFLAKGNPPALLWEPLFLSLPDPFATDPLQSRSDGCDGWAGSPRCISLTSESLYPTIWQRSHRHGAREELLMWT